MTFIIRGLDPSPYRPLFDLPDEALEERGIIRMTVNGPTYPCRVSLTDRAEGESVLLLNHVSNDVTGPYRTSHAIFLTESEEDPAVFVDRVPPVFAQRILSLRGYDNDGMMVDAVIAQPGQSEDLIRRLFDDPRVGTIHAHTATRGCFVARIERN